MALDELRKLIPPPAEPVETGNKTKWAKVEKQLGTKLPDDFKDLIDLYGSGSVSGFYGLFNPFNSDSSGNLMHRFKDYSKNLAEGHANDPENYPFLPFPETPELIPWANDTNGHTYYWLVKAKTKPNDWTVVIDECDGFSEFAGGLTDYLVAVFKGKVNALAGNFPGPGDLRFVQKAIVSPQVAELSDAISARNIKKMRQLIAAGADVNAINDTNSTLLFFAAGFRGPLEPLKLLVEAGADVNGISEEGTPLFSTIYNSEPEKMKYLLGVGADPNAKNHRGDTPLFAAIHNGRTEMIELLATVPGTLTTTNNAKLTPLALAKKKKESTIIEILERASGKPVRPAKVPTAPKAVSSSPPSMQTLLELLPPPASPKNVGAEGRWRMAERHFRTTFPADSRDFCVAYGSFGSLGPIGLVIVNPFNKDEWPWIKGRLNWYRREWTRANDPALYPYSACPEPGGLFPFAAMDQGKEVFYKTEGNPDEWPIVIWDEESRLWHEHKLTLTDFLTALLEGKAVAPYKKGWIEQFGSPLKFVD